MDLLCMFVIGLAGYAMRVYDFPVAPVLIGLILGPMAEKQLRQALAIGQGHPIVLVSSPLAVCLFALAALALLLPLVMGRLKRAAEVEPSRDEEAAA
jgi:putative tricarboxylic transport membrane protein